MIQVPENILKFVASTDQADKISLISKRLFLCLDGSLYPKDIRLSIPFMAILAYYLNCLLGRRWEETAFLVSIHFKFIHSMTKQDEICNAGNNSTRRATSTHETRVSRSTQRSRKPSQTQAERLSLILFFQDKYPGIRDLKIKDTGRMFIARARAGKRYLHAGAFSLQNLYKAFEYECQIKTSC